MSRHTARPEADVPYAELHCHSAFSFLDGASTPEELVDEAVRLRLGGLAITDHDGFYGVVRFYEAAARAGLAALYGAELSLGMAARAADRVPAQEHLLVLTRGQEGYRRLSRCIAAAHLAGGEKGRPRYDLDALTDTADGHWLILTGCRRGAARQALRQDGPGGAARAIRSLIDRFGRGNVAVELTRHLVPTDDEDNDTLAAIAADLGIPVVATTAAHYADPRSARLGAAMAAVRLRRGLEEADPYLPAGAGAHLRAGGEMATLFARYPTAVPNAAAVGAECAFDLRLLAPELPPFEVPVGYDEATYLRHLTFRGAHRRYGDRQQNPRAYEQLEKELRIITRLNFPGYFLVVFDIVQFCRAQGILCQGRGSAANSAVCYALGITTVDAVRYGLLFERFLSPQRQGPPDIDVDIESGRREEVIQYVYEKYGRDRAAQVANVATFRPKMAVRDMAKALGYSPGQQDAFSKRLSHWGTLAEQNTDRSLDGSADIPSGVLDLATQIQDFPRHLGIHSGGMVICDRPVADVCPVEWARMEGRSVLQWDKDDCAAIGLVKFDLLGLGMLSALHATLDLVRRHEGIDIDLGELDLTEPEVYQMLQRADTVGVFQVESRAQMATLPRLKPECFYDLVVEIALIRPGPIQGGSVHPYLTRREAVRQGRWRGGFVPHPAMARSLDKTLGVPLFQEQLMELAIDVAGFDAGQADELRRAMGSKRSGERMERLRTRLYEGMRETHGITGRLADLIFAQLKAFGDFGFAESHALSFAALVFHSAYLKLHHPAAFLAGLLRSQPMGFYSPQSLVADARRHGVTVRRAHVNHSAAQADLEPGPDGRLAVRLGLAGIRGIGADLADEVVAGRPPEGYPDLDSIVTAVRSARMQAPAAHPPDPAAHPPDPAAHPPDAPLAPTAAQLEALATAGALDGIGHTGTSRRQALWAAGPAAAGRPGMLPGTAGDTRAPMLPGMSDIEMTMSDMWATGISPEHYPTEFSRDEFDRLGVVTAARLFSRPHGSRVLVAGIVTHRQRPATAVGVTFINLEDETGMINVICTTGLWRRYRTVARRSRALLVRGTIERDGGAISLLADRIAAIDVVASTPSRDFR